MNLCSLTSLGRGYPPERASNDIDGRLYSAAVVQASLPRIVQASQTTPARRNNSRIHSLTCSLAQSLAYSLPHRCIHSLASSNQSLNRSSEQPITSAGVTKAGRREQRKKGARSSTCTTQTGVKNITKAQNTGPEIFAQPASNRGPFLDPSSGHHCSKQDKTLIVVRFL